MSASIDEKVVSLRFDNKQFERGVQQSLRTIDKLNKATDIEGASKSIKEVSGAFNSFDLSSIENGVSKLSERFSAFGIAGMTVIQNLTNSAIDLGKKLIGVMNAPLQQIKSGGIARALNIEQARFQIEGLGKSWEKVKEDVEYGVNDTAYGLDAAAKVASQLIASNVQIGDSMKTSLRAISGVAAMTNSTYEDIGEVFTTVAGNGRLMASELRRLSVRGINAAATLGKSLGKTETEIREMVRKGQIDFATFAKAMDDAFGEHAKEANKTITGATANIKASLSRIGELFATPIIENAIEPINSLKESTNMIKTALQPAGEQFAAFLKVTSKFVNGLLKDKRTIESVKAALEGVVGVFKYLKDIAHSLFSGFLQIFPPKSLNEILSAAKNFKNFAESLTLTEERASKFRSVARGLASILSVIKNAAGLVKDIFIDIAKSGAGGFLLTVASKLGEVITYFGNIVKGIRQIYNAASSYFGGFTGVITHFDQVVGEIVKFVVPGFESIGDAIKSVGSVIRGFFTNVVNAFSSISPATSNFVNGFSAAIDFLKEKFVSLYNVIGKVVEWIKSTLGKALDYIRGIFHVSAEEVANSTESAANSVQRSTSPVIVVFNIITGIVKGVCNAFSILAHTVSGVMKSILGVLGATNIADVIKTIFQVEIYKNIAGFFSNLQTAAKNISTLFKDFSGIFSSVRGSFDAFSGIAKEVGEVLKSYQMNIKAGAIMKIAIAIGLLAVSLMLFSNLSWDELAHGLAGVVGAMVILITSMKGVGGITGKKIAVNLLAITVSLNIMSSAIKKLANLDIDQIGIALVGMAGSMAILVGATQAMAFGSTRGVLKGAASIVVLSVAVSMLSKVVKSLATLSWEDFGKGLGGLTVIIGELVGAAILVNKYGNKMRARTLLAFVAFSLSVRMLVKPVSELGEMDLLSMGQGLIGLTVIISELVAAAVLISKFVGKVKTKSILTLVAFAESVRLLIKPVKEIGQLSWNQLAVGLTGLTTIISELIGASILVSKFVGKVNTKSLLSLIIFAESVRMLVKPVMEMAGLSMLEIASGLIGLTAVISELIAAAILLDRHAKDIKIKSVASLVIFAIAVRKIVDPIAIMGSMDLWSLAKGLGGLTVIISELVAASVLISKYVGDVLKASVSMAILAPALVTLAGAVEILGAMQLVSIGKGLLALSGSLTILVVALAAIGHIKGIYVSVASVVLMTAAMLAMVPAIVTLGSLDIMQVVVALSALAGSFLILGVASAVLSKLAPAMGKLAMALTKFALAVALFGVGIYALAAGLELFSSNSDVVTEEIPKKVKGAVTAFFELVKEIIKQIGAIAKPIIRAILDIIDTIVDSLIKDAPKIAKRFFQFIIAVLEGLASAAKEYIPKLLNALKDLVMGIIDGIKEWVGELSLLGDDILFKVLATVGIIVVVFKMLASSIGSIKPKNIAGAIVLIAGVAAITAGLLILANQPWDSLIASCVSLTITMAGFAYLMQTISKIKVDAKSVAGFTLGAASLVLIAASLKIIANEDWKSLLVGATSLILIMTQYAKVFKMLSKINVTTKTLASIGLFAAGTLAFIPIMVALKLLAKEDYKSILASAVSLGAVFATYAAVFKLMSTIPIMAAVKAIAGIAIAIGGIALILVALGALRQIPGFEWLLTEGGELLIKLGQIIGEVIGGFVSGIAKGLSSMLPAIGEDLANFMIAAQPFFDGVERLKDGTMDSVSTLAGALLTLTASELIDGIAGLLGSDSDFKALGEKLAEFADGVVTFAQKTSGLNATDVETAANAASLLAQLASDVPLEGGLLGALIGDHIPLDVFGEQLPALADGIMDFAGKVKDLKQSDIDAGANAAQMLVALAGDVPLQGGLLGAIVGDRLPLDDLGDQLPALGKGLKEFADEVTDLNTDDAQKAGTVADMLVNLAKEIPLQGGVLGFLVGNRDSLDTFGDQLPSLGTGLKDFANNVKGLDMNAATNAGIVAQMLAALANTIPDSGGLKSWFAGDNTLEDFGEQLPEFGGYVKEFGDKVKGIDVTAVNSAAFGIKSVVNMIDTIYKTGIKAVVIKKFGEALEELGTKYRSFASDTVAASTEGPKNLKNAVDEIIKAMKKLDKADTSKLNDFFDKVSKTIQKSTESIDLTESGKEIIDSLIAGLNSKMQDLLDCMTTLTSTGSQTIKNQNAYYQMAGQNLAEGFIAGMTSDEELARVKNAGIALAKAADEGITQEAEIHSPSKKGEKRGKQLGDGVKEGIDSTKGKVKESGQDLAGNALDGLLSKNTLFNQAGKDAGNEYKSGFASVIGNLGLTHKTEDTGNVTIPNLTEQMRGQKAAENDKKKRKKKAKKDTAKDVNEILNSSEVQSAASSGGGSVGSTAGKAAADAFSKSDFKKAMKDYNAIMGTYVKNTKDFAAKFLKVGVNKNSGLAFVKTTTKYVQSAINDKYLRTAASTFGHKISGIINKSISDGLLKDTAGKALIKKYRKASRELSDAKKDKKRAQQIIKNSKSTTAQVEEAKKKLADADNRIKKYQAAVDKYGNSLKKSANDSIKKLTKIELKKVNDQYKEFIHNFNSIHKGLGKSLSKMPQVVGTYIKNTKTSSEYMKGAVKAFENQFASSLNKLNRGTNKKIKEIDRKIRKFKGLRKAAKEVLDDKNSTKRERAKAQKDYDMSIKQLKNYRRRRVNQQKKLVTGTVFIDKFAERLYENSDDYKANNKKLTKLYKERNKQLKKAEELKHLIKSTSNKKLKKKYAEELAQLRKDNKSTVKEITQTVQDIAKGPAKKLKEYKKNLIESLKDFVNISNWDISPKITLEGFDKFEKTTNLINGLSSSFNIFEKAITAASVKFSIFGDLTKEATKTVDIFSVSLSDDNAGTKSLSNSAKETAEAFDILSNSLDTGMNLMERFTKTGTYNKDALFEDADSQLEAYEEFYNGIEALRSKGFDSNMIDDLESQGPQALNVIRGFLDMSESEVSSYNNRISKKYDWEAKVLEKNIKKQLSQYEAFNKQIEELAAKGLSEGIIEKLKQSGISQASYVRAMTRMNKASIDSISDIYRKSVIFGANNQTALNDDASEAGQEATKSYLQAIEDESNKNDAWLSKLEKLANTKLDKRIIAQFKEMGRDQAEQYVDSLLEETEEGLTKVNQYYSKYLADTTKTFLEAAQEQADINKAYSDTMARLKKEAAALDPAIIKEIESMGAEEAIAYANSILAHIEDVPKINEIYWSSVDSKTMTENMKEANAEAQSFVNGLKSLRSAGVSGDFVDYIEGLGVDEGMQVLQRALREFKDAAGQFNQVAISAFNSEYYKSKNLGKSPIEVLTDNVNSQTKAYTDYENNLLKASARGVKSDYLQYIKDMGLEGAEYLEAIVNATDAQLKEFNDAMAAREEKNRKEKAAAVLDGYKKQLQSINGFKDTMAKLILKGASQEIVDGLATMFETDAEGAAEKADALLLLADENQQEFAKLNSDYSKALNSDIAKDVNELVAIYAASGTEIQNQTAQIKSKTTESSKQVGIDSGTEMGNSTANNYTSTVTSEANLATYKKAGTTMGTTTGTEASNSAASTFLSSTLSGQLNGPYTLAGLLIGSLLGNAMMTSMATSAAKAPIKEMVDVMLEAISKKEVKKKLKDIGDSFIDGIRSSFKDQTVVSRLKKSVKSVATSVEQTISNVLTIASAYSIVKTYIYAMASAFNTYGSSTSSAASAMAKRVYDAIVVYISWSMGYSFAYNLIDGLIYGLEEEAHLQELKEAAKVVGQTVNGQIESDEEINSPSKVWKWYGEMMVQGLVNGLTENSNNVGRATESITDIAVSSLQNAIANMSQEIENTVDYNPVITPTLDLTRITSQARQLNSMIDNHRISAAIAANESADQNQNGGNVTYNFEQNNYSPKALSREEIYRQTKNQLSAARKAVVV